MAEAQKYTRMPIPTIVIARNHHNCAVPSIYPYTCRSPVHPKTLAHPHMVSESHESKIIIKMAKTTFVPVWRDGAVATPAITNPTGPTISLIAAAR